LCGIGPVNDSPFAFCPVRLMQPQPRQTVVYRCDLIFTLGFWLLQNQVVKRAAVYKFDDRLTYLIPPLVMLTASWGMFRQRR